MTQSTKPALLLVILFQLFVSAVVEAGRIEVDGNLQYQPLNAHIEFFYDGEQTLTVEYLTRGSRMMPWSASDQHHGTLFLDAGRYWLRTQIANTSDHAVDFILQTEYPSIKTADLYILSSTGNVTTLFEGAGLDSPFNNRPILHRHLLSEITIPANDEITLIWLIEDEPALQFRATLWNPKAFNTWDLEMQLVAGFIYGVLFVVALYNLFLYLSTHHKSYGFYVLYAMTSIYLVSASQGHLYQYFAPDSQWNKIALQTVFFSLYILLFGQFTIYFLNLRRRTRKFLWAIRWLAIITVGLLITASVTSSITLILLSILSTGAMLITALCAGIVIRRKGVISAGHFVIAIMILIFALLISAMASLGLISRTGITDSLPALGLTAMLVFFSLALADRVNQLQKEVDEGNESILKANESKLKAEAELYNSKRKLIELEQSASQARLENQSKSDFLATMSHEIRTPMDGILTMTDKMKASRLDEKQNYYLNMIEHSSQDLVAIINDLRDFTQIEAGKMELELSSFNLEALIDDCISIFSLKAVEKHINFIADIDPNLDQVFCGDAGKLKQILLHLLSNAFKFTDQGDVILKVRATDKAAINCTELKFSVEDSGIGLTNEEKKRLFTPFQHADEDAYGLYGGSGLGLAISKQLAELMDGHIDVDSEAGVGSVFWFTARLMNEENPAPELIRKRSSQLADKKLLLVDSHTVSADIVKRLLTSWKIDTTLCTNLEDAISTLESAAEQDQPFDVILSEYNLESASGLDLLKEIRKRQLSSATFVLMAATQLLDKHDDLASLGIRIVLEKPITNSQLHDVLLRATLPPKAAQAVMEPSEEQKYHDLKVLIVDDNQVNQLILANMLKQIGVEADVAENGLRAIQKYEANDYDLILMDCEMPEMDGYQAAAQIRAKEQENQRKRVNIIAISAHAQSDFKERVEAIGMDGHLTKPISLSNLTDLLSKAVSHQN